MRHCPNLKSGFVVNGELVDDVGAGAIVADQLDLPALPPQTRDDLVQRADSRNVPKVRASHVVSTFDPSRDSPLG